MGGTVKLVINEDKTVTYGGEAASSVVLTETSLTFTVGDLEFSFTYDPKTDKMSGGYTYDYEDYPFVSITRVS